MKPKLLILDEPFANLDFKSIYNHLRILENLREDNEITILYTTHNLFFVKHWADGFIVLDNGRILFEGDHNEGLGDSNVKELLGSYDDILSLINKSY